MLLSTQARNHDKRGDWESADHEFMYAFKKAYEHNDALNLSALGYKFAA